ncbi:MAG: hypothetical protein WDO74_00210 [Pseudomonadota bacterium]
MFLGFQALAGRWHAFDYTDDLIFWRATHNAVPRSAKAQLNYSVMLGARGQLEERLKVNAEAMRLAPKWPMAHVYYGDTLCRLKRAEQAWPHYMHGFELAPNDLNLIALGLQCAWEEKIIEAHKDELLAPPKPIPAAGSHSSAVISCTTGRPTAECRRSIDRGPTMRAQGGCSLSRASRRGRRARASRCARRGPSTPDAGRSPARGGGSHASTSYGRRDVGVRALARARRECGRWTIACRALACGVARDLAASRERTIDVESLWRIGTSAHLNFSIFKQQ